MIGNVTARIRVESDPPPEPGPVENWFVRLLRAICDFLRGKNG